jgi:ABC-type branched-subunit amino acid transport system substrate-binding protein
MRQWLRGLGLALGLALAACSSGPVTRPAVAPPPPTAPKAPPPISALPEDKARHRVALLVPLSGPNGGAGQSIANAAVLALADSHDQSLRITTYDTGAGVAAAAQKAVAEGNRLILGPLLGEDAKIVAPIAAAAHVPVLAFSNDLTAAGDDVWLLGFQSAQSIERVIRYARSRGLTRFAGLMPQGTYGRNASTTMIHAVEAAKGTVVAIQTYERTPKSIAAAVATLNKQRFDAVLIADSARGAIAAAPALKKSGARILGTELWNAEAGLRAVPDMQGAWYASVDDSYFDELAAKYRARYGRTPWRLASLGYDAVLLTVRISRDWSPNAPFPVQRLADEGGFSGVDGAFRFNAQHSAERALVVYQLGAGQVSAAPKDF